MINKALILLTVIFINVHGQNSFFKKALILKSDSSTLTGYVEKFSESSLSFGLKFKKSLEDIDHQKFPVADVEQVIFLTDSSIFHKVRYTHRTDTTRIVEYRLAKKLLCGYADLYKLQLPNNELNIVFERTVTFVYIIKIDTNYYTLEQRERLEGTTYHLSRKYLGVLSSILKNDKTLKSKLPYLRFSDKQIVPLIKEFNTSHPEIPGKILIRKEKPIVTHGPVLSHARLDHFEGIAGSGWGIGYSVNVIHPEVDEHVSVDFGITIGQINRIVDNNIRTSGIFFEIPVSCTYHFNDEKISPFAGAGISPCFLGDNTGFFIRFYSGVSFFKMFFVSFTIESSAAFFKTDRFLLFNLGYVFYV